MTLSAVLASCSVPKTIVRRFLASAVLAAMLATVTSCTHVAAYQRGRLAHPTMQLGDMADPAQGHVNAVHEGATGGTLGAASGCGCN